MSSTQRTSAEPDADRFDAALRELAAAPAVYGSGDARPPTLQIGEFVAGRFRVERKIGQGGMGEVYLASDVALERRVALKVQLSTELADGDRLAREAKAMAALSHPNVVPVHEVGRHRDRLFIAMEFVDGPNAREWSEAATRSWRDVLEVFGQAGAGIAAAHDAGLVHRDIKPDNILLGVDGRVRVVDFGLARPAGGVGVVRMPSGSVRVTAAATRPTSKDASVTLRGTLVGTPPYMSPERYAGAELDARSDQFSFCVSLFECVFGIRPFGGEHPREILQRIHAGAIEPVAGRGVPRRIRTAILVGLRPEPSRRHVSMQALTEQLRPARREPRWALGIGVVTVAAAIPLAWSDDEARCANGGDDLHRIWNPGRQEALARDLAGLQSDYASHGLEVAAPRLDAYAEQWEAAWKAACSANDGGAPGAERVVGLRMACLERRADSFLALVRSFEGIDRKGAVRLISHVEGLERIDACADPAALASSPPLPADPQRRASAKTIRAELGRIDDARRLGIRTDHARSLELTDDVLRRARATDDRPSIGWARLLSQVFRQKLDQPVDLDEARAAFNDGIAAGDRELAVSAANFLVRSYRSRDLEQAIAWADTGRAAIERLPQPARAELRLLRREIPIYLMTQQLEKAERKLDRLDAVIADAGAIATTLDRYESARMRAHIRLHRGEPDGALGGLRDAESILAERFGSDHPFGGTIKREIGGTLILLNRPGEAKGVLLEAKPLLEAEHGPGHSVVALVTCDLAELLAQEGEFEQAIGLLEPAIETMRRSPNDARVALNQALVTYSRALTQVGRADDAVEVLQNGVASARERAVDPDTAYLLWNLAFALNEAARHDVAATAAGEAIEIYEVTDDPGGLAAALSQAARADRDRGRHEDAISAYERAIELREPLGHGNLELAGYLQGLALAQLRAGEGETSRATIGRALALVQGGDPVSAGWRTRLEAMLDDLPKPAPPSR